MKLRLAQTLSLICLALTFVCMIEVFICFGFALYCETLGRNFYSLSSDFMGYALLCAMLIILPGAAFMACEDWERTLTYSNTYKRAHNLPITLP